MSFGKNGTVSFHGIDCSHPTFGMDIKNLDDGSVWGRIHYLNTKSNTTFFANSAEVAECTNKTNRYSLMKYVDNSRSKEFELTNMLPAINGTTGFASSSYASASTAHTKYGTSALMLTGAADKSEITIASTGTYDLNPSHVYYARVEIYQEVVAGAASMYWKIAEPNMFSSKKVSAANKWTIASTVKDRSSFEAGKYTFRLDFDNSKSTESMWFDGVMLIDLTEGFGAGKEPTATWCDANIPYFTGTKKINAVGLADVYRYEFMLTYPLLSTTLYNRWSQMSSPNETTVVNYKPIVNSWSNYNAGIRKGTSGSSVYNCSSADKWFGAIGQLTGWTNNSIPAADGSKQYCTELWVRIDNIPDAAMAKIYDGYITASDIIEY